MLLFPVLLATSFWSYMQSVPVQTPELQKQMKGMSASMSCRLREKNEIYLHWYRQLPGEPPKRILYMVDRRSVQKRCVLTIKDVIPDDAATYYCAYWDPHCDRNTDHQGKKPLTTSEPQGCNCLFGSGTKLVVSGKLYVVSCLSPPANSEILQKKHENQIIYVCLIEKFYPEIIRVTWTDDEKEITDQVVKGDTWQSTNGDEYSIASWLTVPAENEDKKYYCKYEHEEEKASLSTQGIFHMFKI
uniref:Ig-like domain-containing protein n=1 Tax=Cyanoderma ruficeps TaxID=181631 RepID=A0A8C3XCV2_9PASS